MTTSGKWINEKWENVEVRYNINEILQELHSDFQHMLLVDTVQYGRMLVLDNIVQTTEKDEFVYHEMMVHVPILSHPDPKNVLIIGGGDGGVLRETLKHDSIEKATMVEIDPKVIEFCRFHLPSLNDGAFDDKRTELVIADGAAFIKETKNRYDVVIVDSPDPIGPAKILFSKDFYRDIHNILNPGGIMVRQTGSIHMQGDEQNQAYLITKDIFRFASFYLFAVPTYIGGFFSSIFCSDHINPSDSDISGITKRFSSKDFGTKYYSPEIHVSAFIIPPFLRARLR